MNISNKYRRLKVFYVPLSVILQVDETSIYTHDHHHRSWSHDLWRCLSQQSNPHLWAPEGQGLFTLMLRTIWAPCRFFQKPVVWHRVWAQYMEGTVTKKCLWMKVHWIFFFNGDIFLLERWIIYQNYFFHEFRVQDCQPNGHYVVIAVWHQTGKISRMINKINMK